MDARIPATATVLTFNSERTIADCLAALDAFDEILVLDGGSIDRTREIAHSRGARVETQGETSGPIGDFTAVRERSFRLASHDWVFVVDSDEIADPTLIAAVRAAVSGAGDVAYRVERVPRVDGRLIRHAYFSPDRVLRLVHRGRVRWAAGKRVHERLAPPADVRVADLPGMLVTPWPSHESFVTKDRQYLHLAFRAPLTARPPLSRTVRSITKNLAQSARITAYAAWASVRYAQSGDALPFHHHLRFARYHLVVARERLRQFLMATRYAPPSA